MAAPTKIGILDDAKMRREFIRCLRKGQFRNKACEKVGFDPVKLSRLITAAGYLDDEGDRGEPPSWMAKSWREEPRRSQIIAFGLEVKRTEAECCQEFLERIVEKTLDRDDASVNELLKVMARRFPEWREHGGPALNVEVLQEQQVAEHQQQGQVINGGFDWSDPHWMLQYAQCWTEILPQLAEAVRNLDEDEAAGKEDKEGQAGSE